MHYIPARYPNGFDSVAPTDYYTAAEGRSAVVLTLGNWSQILWQTDYLPDGELYNNCILVFVLHTFFQIPQPLSNNVNILTLCQGQGFFI